MNKFRSFGMKKLILFLVIAMVSISLYSYRVSEGMIRLTNYDVIHADILGLRHENLYILTRSDVQRELFILHRDDVQAIFRRGRGDRLRREVTSMVFNEPDWFNFNIAEHIDGFTWFNREASHNEAHIELLALITTFAFNDNRLTGVRTFNSLHRQLRSLELTNAYNAELINIRVSIAQGVAVQDLLTQHQTPVRTDIPTLPFFTPGADDANPREAAVLDEDVQTAIQNAVNSLVGNMPEGTLIAVIAVSSSSEEISELILNDIYIHFTNSGNFRMVDAQTVNTMRTERDVRFTGDDDDRTSVEFGRMLGANIVVIGDLIRTGRSETLALRALNVETGEIVGVVRERVNFRD